MTDKFLQANGLQLAYDEFGDPGSPAIVLIMGLGTQMIAWPESLCAGLAERGYRVIRFDNRDIGLSEKMEGAEVPNIIKLTLLSRLKSDIKVPYSLNDMADDAIGVLDALDINAAHFVGASMGGMIAQLVAADYSHRVLSLTSIMSTSGVRSLPGASAKVSLQMVRRPNKDDAEAVRQHSIRTWRLIGSPGYPATDEALLEKLARSNKRSQYPQGYARHMAAIIAGGDRVQALKRITAPTLVIHGNADALVPVEGGIDTAKHIRNAKLERIDGMGHDLPEALVPRFVELIAAHADQSPQAYKE